MWEVITPTYFLRGVFMNVKLYINESNNNVLNKKITLINEYNILLKDNVDVYRPIIKIKTELLNKCNYVFIEDFNRYYYVVNKRSINIEIIELTLECDVLMSFREHILNLKCIIDKQENINLGNKYYDDNSLISLSKEFIESYNFNNGFNENGEFILITAGGGNNGTMG